MRRALVLRWCVAAAGAGVLLAPAFAHAAFPGRNGVIAYGPFESPSASDPVGFDRGDVVGLSPRGRRRRVILRSRGAPEDFEFSPGGRLLAFKRWSTFQDERLGPVQSLGPDVWIATASSRAQP